MDIISDFIHAHDLFQVSCDHSVICHTSLLLHINYYTIHHVDAQVLQINHVMKKVNRGCLPYSLLVSCLLVVPNATYTL